MCAVTLAGGRGDLDQAAASALSFPRCRRSCRKDAGLWQGRLRMNPHSTEQMLLLAVPAQGQTQHLQELCALWAGEKWEWQGKNRNGRGKMGMGGQQPLLFSEFASLRGTSLFKKYKILFIRTDAFRAGYFAEHILSESVILKTKCVSQ